MILRALLAAAVIGGGLIAGRRALDKKIEKQIPQEIDSARRAAIAELDKAADVLVGERLFAFLISLLIKAGLIGGVYWFHAVGHLSAEGLTIAGAVLIAGFVVRDIARLLPFALPALRILRGHDWKFRHALKEFVAGVAFEQAYAEALRAAETGPAKNWIAFSRYNAHNISTEIAEAVADVARSVTFDLVKTRAFLAGLSALGMFGAYLGFFALTFGAVR